MMRLLKKDFFENLGNKNWCWGRANTLRAVGALEGCRSPPGSAIPSTASTTAINSDHCDVTDFRPMREEHRFSRPIE